MPINESKLSNVDLSTFETETESPQLTVSEALKVNPKQHAETQRLSRESGIPAEAVVGAEDEVKRDLIYKGIDFADMEKRAPGTSKYLTDFNNASLSHDDIDTLSALEGVMLAGKNVAAVAPNLSEAASGIFESPLRLISKYLTEPMGEVAKGVFGYKNVKDPAATLADYFAEQAAGSRALTKSLTADNKKLSPFMQDVASGVQSGVHGVALLGAAVLSRNPELMIPLMGASTFGTSASQGLEKGLSPEKAALLGTSQAGIEIFTEKLAFKPLQKILEKDPGFMKNVVGFLAREIPSEQAATVLQDLNDWAMLPENKDKPFTEYLAERPDAAVSTAIATVVGGGIQVGAAKGMSYYYESQYKKAETAAFNVKDQVDMNGQQTIDLLNHYASKSSTRELDGETFRQFVKGIDPDSQIHIDSEQAAEYLNQKTPEEIDADPALQILRDKLAEEGELNTSISIPVADFATDLAGTEHYDELRQHMTVDPETPTPFRHEQAVESMKAYRDRLMDQANETVSQYAESQEIFASVRDQLIDTGRVDAQQASLLAEIVPAYIAVKSKELKLPVAQMYEQFGLKVEGPMTGKAAELQAAGVLKQGEPVEFKPISVADAVAENGGITLNPNGSVFEADTGYVATMRSKNITDEADVDAELLAFAEENKELLSRSNVTIGVFDFGDGNKSIDINVVTPDKGQALQLGKDLNQDSIYDLANKTVIKTGGTGGTGLSLEGASAFLTKRDSSVTLAGIDIPTNESGQIRLTHRSRKEGLTEIDPSFHGTGYTGDETKRKKENPAAWVDRAYYGIEEGTAADYKQEKEIGTKTYNVFIDPASLYDFNADPDNLKAESTDFGVFDLSTYEKNIKEAGYAGYIVNDPSVGLVAASFYKGKVDGEIAATKKQEADAFKDFFAGVTEGEEGKPSLKKEYTPVIDTPVDPDFKAAIDKHRGNFDVHIASSIPGHREVQDLVGAAIAKTFKTGTILDIGASEGAMVKAIAETSEMTGVALDPNDSMEATFNKSPVPGAEYVNAAFGTEQADDGTEAWEGTNWYDPKSQKFDVVHESMVFQFIHNDRDAQIGRVADLVAEGGVAIIEEKLFTDQWDANEAKKNEYKSQYFRKEDMTKKSAEVLEGMNKNMVEQAELESILRKNFKFVTQYWDSGNFKGYAASNDNQALQELVGNIGDTSTEYTTAPVLKQSAFHGTPHKFDKFSLAAMGSGEGAQAYGWGLYFAGKKEIAEYYRDTLSEGENPEWYEDISEIEKEAADFALSSAHTGSTWVSAKQQFIESYNLSEATMKDYSSAFDSLAKADHPLKSGTLYQVDIPEDDVLLDWDKPMSEQSPKVLRALRGVDSPKIKESLQSFEMGSTTGRTIYFILKDELDQPPYSIYDDRSDKKASIFLDSIGIKGLKYSDATSRGKSSGTSNYVIWDEGAVTIEAVNDEVKQAQVYKQSAALRRGTETLKRFGLDPNKRHLTRDVAAALEARTRQKYGMVDRKDQSPEASKKLAKWMVDEVMFELDSPGESGVGWYSEKFQAAIDTFAEQFPELQTDQDARNTLTLLIAITSDGQKVVPNFAQAVDIYSNYRDGNGFTTDRGHQRQDSIDANLQILTDMFSRMTAAEVHENLMQEATISELKKMAKEDGVEFSTNHQAHIKLPMAAIVLGPKLGAFYANLMGSHGYLTMDRWWTRTFNRYRGSLLQSVSGTSDKPTDAKGRKIGLARFKDLIGQPDISDDEALAQTVVHAKTYADKGYKDGTPVEKAANSLYKQAFVNIEDAPYSATDRTFMLDTVNRAQKTLSRKGHKLTVADIQAILWYYEKRLYGELGAKQTADISYQEAAARVIESRGGPAGQNIQLDESEGIPVGSDVFNQPEQTTSDVTRGTYDSGNTLIRLTESSDLSTFLHEFAHFMLDMEQKTDGSQLPAIKNWIASNIQDVAKEATDNMTDGISMVSTDNIREFLANGTTGLADFDTAIEVAIHEQFARGFEAYLMEGKAPSMELRNVFRTFARWLVQVYQVVKGDLNVKLTDEMRQVFDRLIATEEQIAAAEARAKFEPMFSDAAMAGMTDKQFAEYKEKQGLSEDKARETLRDQMIKQLTRQTQKWWKSEKSDLIDEETESLKGEPVYRAITALRGGEFKLDHAAVKEAYGFERTDKRGRTSTIVPPALIGLTIKGGEGVTADDAAAFFGFDSGDQMIKEIIDAPKLSVKAEQNAEARMIERHGDILTDGSIQQLADEAVMNEERGALILIELKALMKGTSQATLDRRTMKFLAEERVGQMSFREINPGKYRAAEIRAAQESATALAEGNKPLAADAKSRQAMNHYLAIAATEAKSNTMKIVDRVARYRKKSVRENIAKADAGYLEQIDKIISRFEFHKTATMKQVDRANVALATWVAERIETAGDNLVLSDAVLDEAYTTHWKNVKYDDLQGINDSLKNIEHVARYTNKISIGEDLRDFQEVVANFVAHVAKVGKKYPSKMSAGIGADVEDRNLFRWANAQMTKIPFLTRWLDNGEPVDMAHDLIMQRFTDALDHKFRLHTEVTEPTITALTEHMEKNAARMQRNIFIEEIGESMRATQVIAVALNTGNVGNLKKMLLGEGWANPENEDEITFENETLQAILSHMTREDWVLVQHVWDQMDKLYPMLKAVHESSSGLAPMKVAATPVVTEFGTFNGGYYPVVYSKARSHKAEKNADKAAAEVDSMFSRGGMISSSVTAGSVNERTGFYDRIELNLNTIPNHFEEVVHYVTHHDAVRQVNRLISSPAVADAITAALGEEEFKLLKPWLNDIAKDGSNTPSKTFIEAMFGNLRLGVTLGAMGFKASTGIMQIFGLFTTASEVGAGKTLKAIVSTVGRSRYLKSVRRVLGSTDDIQSAWDFASTRSKVMNHRTSTMDREIRAAETTLKGKKDKHDLRGKVAKVQSASMWHIAMVQTYMVDLPTWHAAYDKSLSEDGDERKAVKYADWAVENLQGSGATKDMATLMRNQSKLHTTLTMFMTFFSSLGNLARDTGRSAKSAPAHVTAAKVMFLFILPVLTEMLLRGEFDDEDKEPEEMLQETLIKLALYPVTAVPFARDALGALATDYSYNFSPVASTLEAGIQGYKGIAADFFDDSDVTVGPYKAASKLTGVALKIPGVSQAWATGGHIYDVIEEGEELTLRELIYGTKRK